MKKLAIASLTLGLLIGCGSSQVGWQQDNQIVVEQSQIELKSNLWLNKMPTIGEVQDQTLHGALYLEATGTLPAQLDVHSIAIRQGEDSWLIEGDLLELRTHSENQWEIAFVWQFAIDPEQPVDVAVMLHDGDKEEWLVEKQVAIDIVY